MQIVKIYVGFKHQHDYTFFELLMTRLGIPIYISNKKVEETFDEIETREENK